MVLMLSALVCQGETLTSDESSSNSFIVRYKTKTSSDMEYEEISNINSDHYTVRGLKAYTVYLFYIIAINNIGRGPPSAPVEVRCNEKVSGKN